MILVVVESPSKAKTIEKYLSKLGGEYKVASTYGHIRDLDPKRLSVDIENNFKPIYVVMRGKKSVIEKLASLAKKSEKVVLATDEDREGEAISWHLYDLLKEKVGDIKAERITFNEITESAILEAMKNPRGIDMKLKAAQEARRVLDRIFGYMLSELIWKKLRYGLSAGRVQSPALRLVVEREKEIREFESKEYYEIYVNGKLSGGDIVFKYKDVLWDKDEADNILKLSKSAKWMIADVQEKESKRNPYAPFITSTLQQAASSLLGYSPSQTMSIAQKLYESGYITYMRTDSVHLSKEAIVAIKSVLSKKYGSDRFEHRMFKSKNKNAQEAHEAIRPTNFERETVPGSIQEKKLYDLIWRRAVASQFKSAIVKRTKVVIKADNEELGEAIANGSVIIDEGWLEIMPESKGEEKVMPRVEVGEGVDVKEVYAEQKETQPPARYTEAGLVKELERLGIGRPSTYANIIATIKNRGYVVKEGRALVPTDTGEVVSDFLVEHFRKYVDYGFTSEMEQELDEIASGKLNYETVVGNFYKDFYTYIESKKDMPKITNLGRASDEFKCPECGANMVVKLSKVGKFLSCERYPECSGMLSIDGKKANEGEVLFYKDGDPVYLKTGRYGRYLQVGDNGKKVTIPPSIKEINEEIGNKLLQLPREIGEYYGDKIIATIGRFGPYIGHKGKYKRLKSIDHIFEITKDEAIELLKQPPKLPRGAELAKVLGVDPKTKKEIRVLKSKSGYFIMRGLRRIYLTTDNIDEVTIDNYRDFLQ